MDNKSNKPNDTSSVKNDDPFNLENLKLKQNFDETVGVKKHLTTVPIRRPNRQEFFRIRSGSEWFIDTALLEIKDESETYLVAPKLWPDMSDEIIYKRLVVTLNRQGVLALWPLKLPLSDGRLDNWSRSALVASEKAEKNWIKLQSNRSLGAYDIYVGADGLPDPEWPEDYTFQEILDIAFRDYKITDLEHPVIRRLRGKI